MRAPKGKFALTRTFNGEMFSVYAASRYDTKEAAETAASFLHPEYRTRIVEKDGQWLVYIRKVDWD